MKKITGLVFSCLLLAALCFGVFTACVNISEVAGTYAATGVLIDGTEQNFDYAGISLTLDENKKYTLSFEENTLISNEWTISGNTINFKPENNFATSLMVACSSSEALSIIGGADGPITIFLTESMENLSLSCSFKNDVITFKITGDENSTITILFTKK